MPQPEPRRVAAQEALRLVDEEGYIFVDVRSQPEFSQGHPSGAYNVPLRQVAPDGMADNPDFLRVMQAHFPKDARLLLGCRSGNRSLSAARLLLAAGYATVVDQRSGFEGSRDAFGGQAESGWHALGLPVESEARSGRDYASLCAAS